MEQAAADWQASLLAGLSPFRLVRSILDHTDRFSIRFKWQTTLRFVMLHLIRGSYPMSILLAIPI